MLLDFESMPDSQLAIWRNHLLSSFSEAPCARPFRFKMGDGQLPTLTMLKMVETVEQKPARPREKKGSKKKAKKAPIRKRITRGPRVIEPDSADEEVVTYSSVTTSDDEAGSDEAHPRRSKAPRKTGSKKKGNKTPIRKRSTRGSKVIEPDSADEGSMSDGADTFSDQEEGDDQPLPPRTKVLRKAASKASTSIEKVARREADYEEKQSAKSAKPGPSTRTLPGSLEQRQRKKKVSAVENTGTSTNPATAKAVSLFLQTKDMATGTLLNDWKNPTFKPEKVSSNPTLIMNRITVFI